MPSKNEVKSLRVGIDIDGVITEYPDFFRQFSQSMTESGADIYIITNRDPTTRAEILEELREYAIDFNELVITANKAEYIVRNEIVVLFEDTDEYFLKLPPTVLVLKVREPGNFDYDEQKWVYGPKTGRLV
jgi:hypothetical protein